MMHDHEESDFAIVAMKLANKTGLPVAEQGERRVGTERNADQHNTRRAQDRESVSHELDRIRQAARQRRNEKFTALFHHINPEMMRTAFYALRRNAALVLMDKRGGPTRQTSINVLWSCTIGSNEERTGRSHRGGCIYRSRMERSDRLRSPRLRTR